MTFGGFEKPVVGHPHAGVVPDPLGGVEFGPVGRQIENFHAFPVGREPVIDFRFLVVAGVVLDEIDPAAPAVKGGQDHLIQKSAVSLPLEVFLVMQVGELRCFQAHGAKYFLGMTFSPGRDFGLAAAPGPGGVERWRLAKGRLVCKNNHRPFAARVFFRFG